MKNSAIIFAAMLGLVSMNVQAQATTPIATPTSTAIATATLNIKLHPIQSIEVMGADVDIDYKTKEHYAKGAETNVPDHLKIYSTGAFAVSVKSEATTLSATGITETIEASDITVSATQGTQALTGTVDYNDVNLSAEGVLVSSDKGGVDKTVNVKYAAKGDADTYVNKYFNSQNPTVYSTTVVYTITAK